MLIHSVGDREIMNKKSVDILIFTYNQEQIVSDTIDSVITQTYDNINKIIIADDGSTDNTPLIINDFASKNSNIMPILAQKNKGIAHNMNRALKCTNAEYVSFLDGDDLMYNQKIEKQVDFLEANPNLIACAHDMDVFESVNEKFVGKFSETINFKKMECIVDIKSIFDPSMLLCPSSIMYRKEAIPLNGMDTRLKYWYEFLFIVEVLSKGNMGFINETLGLYRLHDANVTSSTDFKNLSLENSLIVYSIIISKFPELHSLVKKRKTVTYLAKILESIEDGNNDKAKILSKVIMSDGSFFKGLASYIISFILNKERANKLYNNRKIKNVFLKHF